MAQGQLAPSAPAAIPADRRVPVGATGLTRPSFWIADLDPPATTQLVFGIFWVGALCPICYATTRHRRFAQNDGLMRNDFTLSRVSIGRRFRLLHLQVAPSAEF